MSDGSSWIEIVLLAMLAAFIGLRLVSVLGKRTGQERPVGDSFRPGAAEVTAPTSRAAINPVRGQAAIPAGTDSQMGPALEAIAKVDPGFDAGRFITGATAAYQMILEAFWSANPRAMEGLVSDEVLENFTTAIGERDGKRLGTRLVSVDSAAITAAEMIGQMAEVTVKFVSSMAAGDGVESTNADVWTFSRHIGSDDPNWLLIATDDESA